MSCLRHIPAGRAALAAALLLPGTAQAATSESALSVAQLTFRGILAVLVLTFALALVLRVVDGLGALSQHRSLVLKERLRTLFGASFLLALFTPFLTLYFSLFALLGFLTLSGALIAAWVWAASPENLNLQSEPPGNR